MKKYNRLIKNKEFSLDWNLINPHRNFLMSCVRVLFFKGYLVRSVTNKQPLSLVVTIYYPWKIRNNIIQHGTEATGLGIMIGRFLIYSQNGRPKQHPANVGCSFFRYTNDNQSNHSSQRHQLKKWTIEDNKFKLHCYSRNKPTQKKWLKSGKNELDLRQAKDSMTKLDR